MSVIGERKKTLKPLWSASAACTAGLFIETLNSKWPIKNPAGQTHIVTVNCNLAI